MGSLSHTIQKIVSSSYDQAFRNTVLPSFEKACQEMFRQVDEAFRAGTSDCKLVWCTCSTLSHAHMSPDLSQLQRQRQQDPSLQQLTTTVCSLQGHVAQLSAPNSPLVQVVQSSVHQELQPMAQQYVRKGGGGRGRLVRSITTPSSPLHYSL